MMLIRKATKADAASIAPLILLAMEEIIYDFIGESSLEKATGFFIKMIRKKANQYSFENCWVAQCEEEIIAAALVYDGAQLHTLRKPVAEQIKLLSGRDFNAGDETQAGEYYIDCIGVKPTHQGKGVGSKMLHFLIDEFAKKGTLPLGLLVDKNNPQAKKLYLRSGFVMVGEKIFAGKHMEHLQCRVR